MKKQTAVEWLIESLESLKHSLEKGIISIEDYIINVQWAKGKAKAMEKEQIIDAINDSWNMAKNSNFADAQAKQYYNETYKGLEQ